MSTGESQACAAVAPALHALICEVWACMAFMQLLCSNGIMCNTIMSSVAGTMLFHQHCSGAAQSVPFALVHWSVMAHKE